MFTKAQIPRIDTSRFDIPLKCLSYAFSLPQLGFGTWQLGGRFTADTSQDEAAIGDLRRAFNCGMRFIDTAEAYGGGHTEELIGKALKGYTREQFKICTKVLDTNLSYDGVIKACEGSLKRLDISHIDLFLIHGPNPAIPIQETMRAMDALIERGMVRNIGVSNFSAKRLEQAQHFTTNKIVLNQLHYNLVVREIERDGTLRYCQDNDVLVCAWRPFQKGGLTTDTPEVLRAVAERYQKTPSQVALNWLISQPNVVTLFKASNPEHLKENLGASGWSLCSADIELLRRDYPGQLANSDARKLI